MTGERIPFVLCVDVEPDPFDFDPADQPPWRGFEALASSLSDMRPDIESATGHPARYAWFIRMDPQIRDTYGAATWPAEAFGSIFDRLRRAGDAFGVHPHAYRQRRRRGAFWIADHADQTWVEECVATSFDAFGLAFGAPPALHRFGARWMNDETMRLLGRLGCRVDMTPEPGTPPVVDLGPGQPMTGMLPDYTVCPRTPYRPGEDLPWVIPLSALVRRSRPGEAVTRRIRKPVRSAAAALRRLHRLLRGARTPQPAARVPYRPITLAGWRSPTDLWRAVVRHIEEQARPYLAVAVRSSIGAEARHRDLLAFLGAMTADPLARRLSLTTPDDLLREFGYLR